MSEGPRRRIAWAGPWNGRSAIAASSGLVVAELAARGHEVEVFRTETGELLEAPVRHRQPRQVRGQLNDVEFAAARIVGERAEVLRGEHLHRPGGGEASVPPGTRLGAYLHAALLQAARTQAPLRHAQEPPLGAGDHAVRVLSLTARRRRAPAAAW